MSSRCSTIARCAASWSWRKTASKMRRLPSREISDLSMDRNNRHCESSSNPSMTSIMRSTTVLCVQRARRSWNSASSSAPEWPFATRSSWRRMTSSSLCRSSGVARAAAARTICGSKKSLAKVAHAVEHAGDRGDKVLDGDLADVVSPAVAALDEAGDLELADGLSYHGAAHLELLGEPPLRGQRPARSQLSAGYEVPDPGRHLLVELDAPDRLYRRVRRAGVGRLHRSQFNTFATYPTQLTCSASGR